MYQFWMRCRYVTASLPKGSERPPQSSKKIYAAGKSKPVRQSEFFETMSEANNKYGLQIAMTVGIMSDERISFPYQAD
jgi:hypothetical protein